VTVLTSRVRRKEHPHGNRKGGTQNTKKKRAQKKKKQPLRKGGVSKGGHLDIQGENEGHNNSVTQKHGDAEWTVRNSAEVPKNTTITFGLGCFAARTSGKKKPIKKHEDGNQGRRPSIPLRQTKNQKETSGVKKNARGEPQVLAPGRLTKNGISGFLRSPARQDPVQWGVR